MNKQLSTKEVIKNLHNYSFDFASQRTHTTAWYAAYQSVFFIPYKGTENKRATCRESMATGARDALLKYEDKSIAQHISFATHLKVEKCLRYFNRVEGTYNFKERTSVVHRDSSLKGSDGKSIYVYTLRLAKEWLMSPTLHQLATLILRLFNKGIGSDEKVYKGLTRFNDREPMNAFSSKAARGISYGDFVQDAQLVAHVLLEKREELFGESQGDQWKGKVVEGAHGPYVQYSLFSYSGPTSFAHAVRCKVSSPYYQKSKIKHIKSIFKAEMIRGML